MKIPMGGKPGPISKIAEGVSGTGRHGGKLVKAAVGKQMGHSKAPVTPVKSDRGNFSIKG